MEKTTRYNEVAATIKFAMEGDDRDFKEAFGAEITYSKKVEYGVEFLEALLRYMVGLELIDQPIAGLILLIGTEMDRRKNEKK